MKHKYEEGKNNLKRDVGFPITTWVYYLSQKA